MTHVHNAQLVLWGVLARKEEKGNNLCSTCNKAIIWRLLLRHLLEIVQTHAAGSIR
jgi:hypothetical protein